MAALIPPVEAPAPGLLVVRYEWPEQLEPEIQGELVDRVRALSAHGSVGLVLVLAPRICEFAPTVRVFWRRVVCNPQLRVRAMAVVTSSWAVEVEVQGFERTNALSGTAVRVRSFRDEAAAVAWMQQIVREAQPV